MRAGAAILTLGLVVYLSTLVSASWSGTSAELTVSEDPAVELLTLRAGRYVLNVRAECPVRVRVYSALTNRTVASAGAATRGTLTLDIPESSIYAVEFGASERAVCGVKAWVGPIETRRTLTSKLALSTACTGFALEAFYRLGRRRSP